MVHCCTDVIYSLFDHFVIAFQHSFKTPSGCDPSLCDCVTVLLHYRSPLII